MSKSVRSLFSIVSIGIGRYVGTRYESVLSLYDGKDGWCGTQTDEMVHTNKVLYSHRA